MGDINQRICRRYPGLFVILLDQSGSMQEKIEDRDYQFVNRFYPDSTNAPKWLTKAHVVTAAVNTVIPDMRDAVGVDNESKTPNKSVYFAVLGYNDKVEPLIPKSRTSEGSIEATDIVTLYPKYLGMHIVERPKRVPEGMMVDRINIPYWIKPRATGRTQMAKALKDGIDVAKKWLHTQPEYISELRRNQESRDACFPPVIINITDARPNGEGDPLDIAKQIQEMGAREPGEELLIFNCHLSTKRDTAVHFPNSKTEFQHLDDEEKELAERMLEMSSALPNELYDDACKALGRPIKRGAHCYVYNADPNELIRFLRWGTRPKGYGTGSKPR